MREHGLVVNGKAVTTTDLPARVLSDLNRFAVPRHVHWDPLGFMAVRRALQEALSPYGSLEEQHFAASSSEGVNFILKLPGRDPALQPLLVGAHYDGPPQSVGADDNASGIAALLELTRRWSACPPRRPVWIVAFDQEELGLLGSTALARQLQRDQQPLHLMVSLEMLAYTSATQAYPHQAMARLYGDRGDFIALVGNLSALFKLAPLAHAMGQQVKTKLLPVPCSGRLLPDVRRSDHSPFWDRGFDALMVTDTSFLRNPNYHTMQDTVSSLDLPFLASVIHALESSLSMV